MTTKTTPDQLEDVPIADYATRPDPAAWHEALRKLGTHARGDQWIVSTPADVAAVLSTPGLHVVAPLAGDGPAAELIARMARFSEGQAHQRRRAMTVSVLPPVATVTAHAADIARRYLRDRPPTAELDVMPLARTLAPEALARAMGLSEPDAACAAEITGRLCDALASARTSDADVAASQLRAALRPLGTSGEDEMAAAVSVLFQARDATAALIGAAVLAAEDDASNHPADRVETVLRHQAPTQCTRRTAVAATTIGRAVIPRGSDVWVFVAAAETGSGVPATFGSGPHGCPGADSAVAIARAVSTVLGNGGWRPAAGQRIDFEPRPNLRLPRRVVVSRG
jgi:cytochrome P450